MARSHSIRQESDCYDANIKDMIEAQYMATRLPWQTRRLERMSDTAYCEHMETVLQCRLGIMGSKDRVEARRLALVARKAKRRNETLAAKLKNAYRDCYKKGKT